jgi:Meiotically Up-regulated Gene 113 (MUG113) protein
MTKAHILSEIKRTAAENGGVPLGVRKFGTQTGIRLGDWYGRFWRSWGDAVREAGFAPNTLQGRTSDEHLLAQYAALTRELGRAPVEGDLRLAKRRDPTFPSSSVLTRRYGSYAGIRARVLDYCTQRGGFDDVVPLLGPKAEPAEEGAGAPEPQAIVGFVYLMKSGKHYKIGKTNAVGRRERELAIQLPEKPRRIHTIKTDDPAGIEAYWHKRFEAKRKDGEWFALDAADVAAFKRRTFQ